LSNLLLHQFCSLHNAQTSLTRAESRFRKGLFMPNTTIKKVEAGSSPRPPGDYEKWETFLSFAVVVTDSSKVDACACVEQIKTV
jgi:hypothetical protein